MARPGDFSRIHKRFALASANPSLLGFGDHHYRGEKNPNKQLIFPSGVDTFLDLPGSCPQKLRPFHYYFFVTSDIFRCSARPNGPPHCRGVQALARPCIGPKKSGPETISWNKREPFLRKTILSVAATKQRGATEQLRKEVQNGRSEPLPNASPKGHTLGSGRASIPARD